MSFRPRNSASIAATRAIISTSGVAGVAGASLAGVAWCTIQRVALPKKKQKQKHGYSQGQGRNEPLKTSDGPVQRIHLFEERDRIQEGMAYVLPTIEQQALASALVASDLVAETIDPDTGE
jgi:hypothetical protein